ncbi:MAG: kinase [Bacteroidetes bacterium 47-18]|nr:MAG: kinase [Bacteroidetes bacterium 47-18]
MENLLYYPYINIPQTDWTKRVLLYYDKVASIVPQRYFYHPDEYDPFMKDMVRMELVEPVNPLEVLDNPWGISAPFIDYIKIKDFKLTKRLNAFQLGKFGRIHRDKFALNGPRIHIDKFDGEIFYQLEQAGLAVRQDGEWYIVEQRTANELMTFLASVIGGKLRYQPTTDTVRKRFTLKESKKEFQAFKIQNEKRELILNELIPFPEQLDLTQLKKFKERHHDILKAFKNRIELIVLNPTIEEGSPLFVETINELKLRKEELSAKMNENKFGKIFYGTVCGIVGAGVGLATAGTLGSVIAGLPGFANAIYSALQIERAEDIFDQSGMKYLALADKRLRRVSANS